MCYFYVSFHPAHRTLSFTRAGSLSALLTMWRRAPGVIRCLVIIAANTDGSCKPPTHGPQCYACIEVFIPHNTLWVRYYYYSLLQMRALRERGVKHLPKCSTTGHRARIWTPTVFTYWYNKRVHEIMYGCIWTYTCIHYVHTVYTHTLCFQKCKQICAGAATWHILCQAIWLK